MQKILTAILMMTAMFSLPPIPTNYAVLDGDGRINAATVNHVSTGNDQLYFDTGSEIFFYVMNFVPMGAEIEDYTLQVFNHWQPGRAATNNGVLVTMAVEEDLAWMIVGEGLNRQMSAAAINNLMDNHFFDYFDAGDFNAAIISLYDALTGEIYRLFPPNMHQYQAQGVATPVPVTQTTPQSTEPPGIGGFVFVIILVLLVVVFAGGGRGRRMRRMTRGTGMGGMMGGFMLGRMSANRHRGGWGGPAPRGGSPGTGMGSGYRPPSPGGGLGGAPPRRPGAGGFGGYGGGRGGSSLGGGGGRSRGGMGGAGGGRRR
ncbi:MAG: TPM domain-containing protein [Defluviitaleaceae bacterium]|nr:TPM domain-containing protein [Defluviitaleaceae bacterium]